MLHHAAEPLILPNAWDAASARLVQEAGFRAVATTSSGVAAALGFSDGEQMPVDEVFAAVWRIGRVLDVPLTADLEAGYGLAPRELVSGVVSCSKQARWGATSRTPTTGLGRSCGRPRHKPHGWPR
jgi:2-methylisocitrate lyase-like PEP mutase family enzyme